MEHMYIFWEKIERSLQKYSVKGGGGCILWSGSSDRHGYGRKTVTWCTTGKHKVELAHRVAYMLHKKVTDLYRTNDAGDLMDVSHLCHEKLCINPDHLVFERHVMLVLDLEAARRSILHLAFCDRMIAFCCYTVSVIFFSCFFSCLSQCAAL